jgi:hypothetical protein
MKRATAISEKKGVMGHADSDDAIALLLSEDD